MSLELETMGSGAPEGWLVLDATGSTQDVAARIVAEMEPDRWPEVVLTRHQTEGKGRFGRAWHSAPGSSLAMTLLLAEHAGHPRPWLLGMAIACTAAETLRCRLQWPNDLFLQGRKLGGILTDMVKDRQGRTIPLLGIGVNLNQTAFPPGLEGRAVSLAMHRPGIYDPLEIARLLARRFQADPAPRTWKELEHRWAPLDETSGKRYRTPDGRQIVATGIGPQGELEGETQGERVRVLAAEAILGA
jgi:BirA family transcriptional regulator, biotin operon repressor / biotin---[acetyl-CoA-carboxylase] ligase